MVDDQHLSGGLVKQTAENSIQTTTIEQDNFNSTTTTSNPLESRHSNDWPPFNDNATTISLASAPTLGANSIFPTSKKSIKFPIISQDKFHWDQVSHS